MEIKVATIEDLQRISEFERNKKLSSGVDQVKIQLSSWNEPWREESLRFYLDTGWCFVANQGDELAGFILCQPLLFFQSWTQSLWIEYLSGENNEIAAELVDVAWRWARSKHLQMVFFNRKFVDETLLKSQLPNVSEVSMLKLASAKVNEE